MVLSGAVAGSLTIAPTAVGAAATLNGNSRSMHVVQLRKAIKPKCNFVTCVCAFGTLNEFHVN